MSVNSKQPAFTRTLISAAILATLPVSGLALDTNDEEKLEVEEVVVTGFRKSLENAIAVKRDSDIVAEVVSADDIGSLPDQSISDALGRLPGVATVRTGGQAGAVNIRGLSGDFVFATMNGREQVATSGNRTIEFDQYPSELISQAAVYKSPKASLIEGGVAGSIEMTTANPLDKEKEHNFTANVRASYNDRAGSVAGASAEGHRVALSYTGKFADDTFGVSLGMAQLVQPFAADQFIGLLYQHRDYVAAGADFVSEGFEIQHKGGRDERNGYLAVATWQPNDSFTLSADAFISKFETDVFARGFRVKNIWDGIVTNPVVSDGALIGGDVAHDPSLPYFMIQTTQDDNSDTDEVKNFGLNAEWNLDSWVVKADISSSSAESYFRNGVNWVLPFQDSGAAAPVVADDVAINYQLNGLSLPSVSFNRDMTGLDSMMLAKSGIYPYISDDQVNAMRLDFLKEVDFGFINSIEFGVRYSEREFNAKREVWEFGNDWGQYAPGQEPLQLTPDMTEIIDFEGDFAGFPSYIYVDMTKALDAWVGEGNYEPASRWANNWTMIQSGRVNEDVTAAYVMANLDTEMFGLPLTGNLGVRVVYTDQRSSGYQQVGSGNGEPIADDTGVISDEYIRNNIGQDYTDVLPSVNLNFELSDDEVLRVAAAKVMARAPIDKLKSGGGSWIDMAGTSAATYNVWGGTSPLLDPFYATQLDVSFERYFGERGIFVAAAFYKDIESMVSNITYYDYDFVGNGFEVPINPITGTEYVGGQYQTAYNNDNGGYISGVEIAYTNVFESLPGAWSGLGFTGSYSYTTSEIEEENNLSGTTRKTDLSGLSKNVFSATLFWDYENFSARVNTRYRDKFVGDQVAVESQKVYYADEMVVDLQTSYNFSNGVQAVLQVNNLTDEPTRTYFGTEAQTGTLQYFGRQVFLGINYSL